jgi:anti-sigma regulatory factor (Ser/Thr protein kinase)
VEQNDPGLGGERLFRRYPAETTSPAEARHATTDWLHEHRLADDVAGLVVTELVANSVMHAKTSCEVALTLAQSGIEGSVFDRSPEPPQVDDHDVLSASGRGLRIVMAYTSTFGVRVGPEGKRIEFTIPIEPPRPF